MKKFYLLFSLCLILISCSTTTQIKKESTNSEIPLKKKIRCQKIYIKEKI